MYLSFYKLQQSPFKITTDPKYLWLGKKHKKALDSLKNGVLGDTGFLSLTGDVGTGKTTLINALIKGLDEDVIVGKVADPGMEFIDFMNFVSYAFKMRKEFVKKSFFITHFTHFLNTAYTNGKKVLLIIDESQRLNSNLLEEIRLLSNIERRDAKLLNTFFIGHSSFNDILEESKNRAMQQSIIIHHSLEKLDIDETGEMIRHRLEIAGATGDIFDQSAIDEVFNYSQGTPRKICIICDHSLLTGYVQEQQTITAEIILECADGLRLMPEAAQKELSAG